MRWANLTHLAMGVPEVVSHETEKFLILLDQCPNLDWLNFGSIAVVHSHPNLCMHAVILYYSNKDPIFNLIFPKLEFLKVWYNFDGK